MPTHETNLGGLRRRLLRFVEHRHVQRLVTVLILVNAITLGLETSAVAMEIAGDVLSFLDRFVIAMFVIELAIKLIALGPRFPRDPWNVFDFVVVGIGLFPATEGFSVLRALRVLRVLRLVSVDQDERHKERPGDRHHRQCHAVAKRQRTTGSHGGDQRPWTGRTRARIVAELEGVKREIAALRSTLEKDDPEAVGK